MDVDTDRPRHVLVDLGFAVRRTGDGGVHGSAEIVPEMWVPGTTNLRTSILATWVDHVAGLAAIGVLAPRVPVTLELDVHVYDQAPSDGEVHALARVLKAGRTVVVCGVDITDRDGQPVAIGTASFMAAPTPGLELPPEVFSLDAVRLPEGRLSVPFAERAGCRACASPESPCCPAPRTASTPPAGQRRPDRPGGRGGRPVAHARGDAVVHGAALPGGRCALARRWPPPRSGPGSAGSRCGTPAGRPAGRHGHGHSATRATAAPAPARGLTFRSPSEGRDRSNRVRSCRCGTTCGHRPSAHRPRPCTGRRSTSAPGPRSTASLMATLSEHHGVRRRLLPLAARDGRRHRRPDPTTCGS